MISISRGRAQRIDSSNMRSDLRGHDAFRYQFTNTFARGTRLALGLIAVSALAACHSGFGSSESSSMGVGAVAKPIINLAPNPRRVITGGSATLEWSVSEAENCVASGGWSGPRATTGSASINHLTSSRSYVLTCSGPGGSASLSTEVVVTAPAPSVSLSASPTTVATGGTATLTWSSIDAAACTASGGWSGSVATSGSQSTGALSATTDYELTCNGPGGSATQSTTVTVTPASPVISLNVNPSTVTSGNAATITWSSTNASSCTAQGTWTGTKSISGSQSTGALTANANYTLTCTGAGGSASQSASVTVTPPAPTVSFGARPSTVQKGSDSMLSWSSANATSCIASGAWKGNQALSGSQVTPSLPTTAVYVLTCTGAGGSATQSTTVTVAPSSLAPIVNLSLGPSAIASGGSSTLNWSSTNATSCSASGDWSGSKAVRGSESTGNLSASSTYMLTCTGAGGSASQSATVSVTAPAPTITLSASPTSINSGSSATLTWSTTHATTCTASDGWSRNKPISGTQSTGPLTANTIYSLTCTGPGGSAAQSATVTVSTPSPAVTMNANPSTVSSGASSTLTWSSTNATACTASNGWTGTKPTRGSYTTVALSAATKFTLTCSGTGGSASQSATISVAAAPPSVSLSASPSSINSGGTSLLTWTTSNAATCTASGGWSGSVATRGSQSTAALSATTTYTLSCAGSAGSALQSATVTVTPATTPANGTATLNWEPPTANTDGTPVTPLSGYHVFYGTSASALTQSIAVSGASTTSYEITGLTAGTWYFAIAADATDGTESAQSNLGSKTI